MSMMNERQAARKDDVERREKKKESRRKQDTASSRKDNKVCRPYQTLLGTNNIVCYSTSRTVRGTRPITFSDEHPTEYKSKRSERGDQLQFLRLEVRCPQLPELTIQSGRAQCYAEGGRRRARRYTCTNYSAGLCSWTCLDRQMPTRHCRQSCRSPKVRIHHLLFPAPGQQPQALQQRQVSPELAQPR